MRRQKPGAPAPPSGQPPSFKTNVNRNKTKRWVNAKSYSYDGDDWGSSGDDDESDEETPDVPPLPGNNNNNNSSNVKASPAQQQAPAVGTNAQDNKNAGAPSQPHFVRPADIYKRMAQEQEQPRPQASQPEDEKPKTEHAEQPQPAELPQLKDFSSGFGEGFMGGGTDRKPAPAPQPPSEGQDRSPDVQTPEGDLHHNPSSGFRSVVNQAFDTPDDPDSLARSNTESTTQISPIIRSRTNTQEPRPPLPDAPPTIEEEPADRRESLPSELKPGFRRSLTPPNSESGPAHSPVVSETRHPPTLSEFAQMSEAPSSDPDPGAPSTSSRNVESPKPPELTIDTKADGSSSAQTSRPASAAARDDLTRNTPQLQESRESTSASPVGPQVPLKDDDEDDADPSSQHDAGPPVDTKQTTHRSSGEKQGSPVTSDAVSPNSVNDRLREDIMQTLNSGASQSPPKAGDLPKPGGDGVSTQEPGSSAGPQSALKSNEYDSHWNEERAPDKSASPAPLSSRGRPVAEDGTAPDGTLAAQTSSDHGEHSSQPSQPQLKKRFSWEDDSDEEPSSSQPLSQSQPNQPSKAADPTANERAASPAVSIPSSVGASSSDSEPDQLQDAQGDPEKPPRYSMILPHSAAEPTEPSEKARTDGTPVETTQVPPSSPQSKTAHVRDIMAMQSHDQKLSAFNQTRDQFATADTGLDAWIQYIGESLPEYADVIALNGQLPSDANLSHKAMGRSKFPKFSSLGTLSFPSPHHDGSGGRSTHARQPSTSGTSNVAHGQQVQAKGKEFLHSAGVLGGKAGGAAKGLFAKGRSRLRNTGSGDKVDS